MFHRRFTAEQPSIFTCNIRWSFRKTAAQYRKPPFARLRLLSDLSSTLQHSWLPKFTWSRASHHYDWIKSPHPHNSPIQPFYGITLFASSAFLCLMPASIPCPWSRKLVNAITTDIPNFVIKVQMTKSRLPLLIRSNLRKPSEHRKAINRRQQEAFCIFRQRYLIDTCLLS